MLGRAVLEAIWGTNGVPEWGGVFPEITRLSQIKQAWFNKACCFHVKSVISAVPGACALISDAPALKRCGLRFSVADSLRGLIVYRNTAAERSGPKDYPVIKRSG